MGGFIDVGIGLIDDYRDGASTTKMLSNAKVNFAFGTAESLVIGAAFALNPLAGVGAIIVVVGFEIAANPREPFYDAGNSLE